MHHTAQLAVELIDDLMASLRQARHPARAVRQLADVRRLVADLGYEAVELEAGMMIEGACAGCDLLDEVCLASTWEGN